MHLIVPKTNLCLLKYSLTNFLPPSYNPCQGCLLSWNILLAFLASSSLMSSNVPPIYVFLCTLPFFKQIFAHSSSKIHTKCLFWVPCPWHSQSAVFSKFVNRISAIQKSNGKRESLWNIPLCIWMGCNCITACFVFNWRILFHVSIDSLHNLTILLFTPTISIDFSSQPCETLSSAFW